MANGIIVDQGKEDMLSLLLTGTPVIEMGLIQADPTWTHSTVVGDLTESSFSSYTRQTTTSWSTPALDGSFDAVSTADPLSWTNTGSSQDVYGWFYFDSTNSLLIGGGLFDAMITLTTGLTITLTPTLQTQSQY